MNQLAIKEWNEDKQRIKELTDAMSEYTVSGLIGMLRDVVETNQAILEDETVGEYGDLQYVYEVLEQVEWLADQRSAYYSSRAALKSIFEQRIRQIKVMS